MYNPYQAPQLPMSIQIQPGISPVQPNFPYSPLLNQSIGFIGSTLAMMVQEDPTKNQPRTMLYNVLTQNGFNNQEFMFLYQLTCKAVEVSALQNRTDPMAIIKTVADRAIKGFLAYIWGKYCPNQPLPNDIRSYLTDCQTTFNNLVALLQQSSNQYNGAAYGQYGSPQPQYGQVQYGQQYGSPQYGQSPYGSTPYGNAYPGNPQMGYPQVNPNVMTNPMAMGMNNVPSLSPPGGMNNISLAGSSIPGNRFAQDNNLSANNPSPQTTQASPRNNAIPMSSYDTSSRFSSIENNQWKGGKEEHVFSPNTNNIHQKQINRIEEAYKQATATGTVSVENVDAVMVTDLFNDVPNPETSPGRIPLAPGAEEKYITPNYTLPKNTPNKDVKIPLSDDTINTDNILIETDDPYRAMIEWSRNPASRYFRGFQPGKVWCTLYLDSQGRIHQRFKVKEYLTMKEEDHDLQNYINNQFVNGPKPTVDDLRSLDRVADNYSKEKEALEKEEEKAIAENRSVKEIPVSDSEPKVVESLNELVTIADCRVIEKERDSYTQPGYLVKPMVSKRDYTEVLSEISKADGLGKVLNTLSTIRNDVRVYPLLTDIYSDMVLEILNIRMGQDISIDDLNLDYKDLKELLESKNLLETFEKEVIYSLKHWILPDDKLPVNPLKGTLGRLVLPENVFANCVNMPVTLTTAVKEARVIGLPMDDTLIGSESLQQPFIVELGKHLYKRYPDYAKHYLKTEDNRVYQLVRGAFNKEMFFIKKVSI